MTYVLVYWFLLPLGWCSLQSLYPSAVGFLFWWFPFLCWTSHFMYCFLNFRFLWVLTVHWNSLRELFWIPCQTVHRSPAAWSTRWVSWQHLWAGGGCCQGLYLGEVPACALRSGGCAGWALWLLMVDISGCSWPDDATGWILCRATCRAISLEGPQAVLCD